MQKLMLLLLPIVVITLAILGWRWSTNRESAAIAAGTAAPTLGDRRLRKAEALIKFSQSKHQGYNLLAAALLQKARETGDFSFNAKAEQAVNQSLNQTPDNFDGVVLNAKVLLAYHQFGKALDVARRARSIRSESPDAFVIMSDAQVELGDYTGAVDSAQRAMNLRPDTGSNARASYLRALHGDLEGAAAAMRDALRAANPLDAESVAWCRVQLANQLLGLGRVAEAERELDVALQVLPDFYLALSAKARVRAAANDYDAAIDLYKRALNRVPLPDTAMALGDLLDSLGRKDEASRQYELVEFIERSGGNAATAEGGAAAAETSSTTYSPLLALFWADRNRRVDEALAIARRERAARSDVYTCDLLAWCLFKNGELVEAKTRMNEALRLGTPDARLFYHAGMIHKALGDRAAAANFLNRALAIRASFDNSAASFSELHAALATRALKELAN